MCGVHLKTIWACFESALSFADAIIIKEILNLSLGMPGSTPTDSWNKMLAAADTDFPSARAELLRAIGRSRVLLRPEEVRIAVERYQRSFEKSIIAKFFTEIASISDPCRNRCCYLWPASSHNTGSTSRSSWPPRRWLSPESFRVTEVSSTTTIWMSGCASRTRY